MESEGIQTESDENSDTKASLKKQEEKFHTDSNKLSAESYCVTTTTRLDTELLTDNVRDSFRQVAKRQDEIWRRITLDGE